MNIKDFENEWNSKKLDFDGAFGAQCVDLIKEWFKENGLFIPHGNAIDYKANAHDGVTWVDNTPSGVPSPGDTVVWGSGIGSQYGHVALFLSGNASSFVSLDQNFPLNSGIHEQSHTYKGVLGWLKLPQVAPPPPPTPVDPKDQIITDLQESVNQANARVSDLTNQVTDLTTKLTDSDGKLNLAIAGLADANTKLDEETVLHDNCVSENLKLQDQIIELNKALNHCINQPAPTVPVVSPPQVQLQPTWIQKILNFIIGKKGV